MTSRRPITDAYELADISGIPVRDVVRMFQRPAAPPVTSLRNTVTIVDRQDAIDWLMGGARGPWQQAPRGYVTQSGAARVVGRVSQSRALKALAEPAALAAYRVELVKLTAGREHLDTHSRLVLFWPEDNVYRLLDSVVGR